jgi:hypothetical protein
MNEIEELETLDQTVSDVFSMEEAMPVEEALHYGASLAQTLRRMHRQGSVCGCLAPDRIVWNHDGVQVLPHGGGDLTPYLSPEQVRGEPADARSDVFAFGAIVYEMLSGRKAFPAQDPEELRNQILDCSPAPLDGVPEEISALLNRCLEKRREDRWQRMNSVVIELKLASAAARQAHSVSEWKDRITILRSQISRQEGRLSDQQAAQESVERDLRQAMRSLEDKMDSQKAEIAGFHQKLAAVQESVAGLQKGAQIHTRAIEGLEAAASQTDEVLEHVVEAFGMLHKSMVERGEAQVLLVSRNGN